MPIHKSPTNRSHFKSKWQNWIAYPTQDAPFISVGIMCLKIVTAIVPVCQTALVALFIDAALQQKSFSESVFYVTLLAGLVGCQWGIELLLQLLQLKLKIAIQNGVYIDLIERQSQMPYERVESREYQERVARIGEDPSDRLTNGYMVLCELSSFLAKSGLTLVWIAQYSWILAAVFVLIGAGIYNLSIKSGWVEYDSYEDAMKPRRLANYLQGLLTDRRYAEERTLNQYSDSMNGHWLDYYEAARKIEMRAELKNYVRMTGAKMAVALATMIMAVAMLWPLQKGLMTTGAYVGLMTLLLTFVKQLSWQLSEQVKQFAFFRRYMADIQALYDMPLLDDSHNENVSEAHPETIRTIEFKNVHYAYLDGQAPVLRGLSCVIDFEKHKSYAFVGLNGAGKTTLTKLLTGLLTTYEGDILINGTNLKNLSPKGLRDLFSQVHQDYMKYHISLKDNLLLGQSQPESLSKEALDHSLNQTGLIEKVGTLPKGIETELGKLSLEAVDLSGGEWQKIAVARALLKEKAVLILDEPTAAMDPIQERSIYEQFKQAASGRSSLLITHRLGATKMADCIMVLEEGKLSEQGTHDALMAQGGSYSNMYEAQVRWYDATCV